MARLPYLIPYDPDFLGDGFRVPLLTPICKGRLIQAGRVFDYIHYSLVMHQDRRIALYTAHNIDVAQRHSVPRTDDWDLDPRIELNQQTGPAAYANNDWDRGHLTRRADVAWGTRPEAQDASDATFYYTNAAPQHARFNQDEWLKLEDWVLQAAGGISSRLCVFAGPIYTKQDQFFQETRIPSAFWKVVVLRDPTAAGNDLSALGFVMKQNELWDNWNGAAMLDLHLYQVGIPEIGGYAGIEFGELGLLDEFEWRQPRFRDRSRMLPVPIGGPEDIGFFGDRRRSRGIRSLRIGPPPADAPAGRAVVAQPCGCSGTSISVEEQVDALATQVRALQSVVDVLLEKEVAEEDRRALREVQRQYARIVGGEMVGTNEFPHCACIGGEGDWFCSGVLIHERVVVTAAHCAPAIDRVYLDGRSINFIGTLGELVNVERVIVHPDYDQQRTPSHDIAVLILAAPAQTEPVALATLAEVDGEDNLTLVGFGYEHPSLPIGFGTKRKVDVPLTNLTGISAEIIDEIEHTHGFDAEFELYAGRKELGKDSCNGDSGGPAYLLVGETYKLAGVTSRAAFSSVLPCGDGGIYTRITPYLAWLGEVTGGLMGTMEEEPAPAPAATLYISAAQPNPAGTDAGNEWVEITNGGAIDIALDGYTLADRQGGRQDLSGPLSARTALKIFLTADSPVKLSNSGDEIILLRQGEVVHQVSYTTAGSGEILRFQSPQVIPETPGGGTGGGTGGGPCGGSGGGPAVLLPDADPC